MFHNFWWRKKGI